MACWISPIRLDDLEVLTRRQLPADTIELARFLLGKLIVRKIGSHHLVGRIADTEAYLVDDPASHSFGGPTARNGSMFLRRGHAYVYRIYGMWHCLNVTFGRTGTGCAVLLRSLEPVWGIRHMRERRGEVPCRDLARGPGRLCVALGVDIASDGADLCETGAL
jgi:DNA-3-methyladenine glycosylase